MWVLASMMIWLVGVGEARAGDAEVAEADALFREGRALLAEGNYLRACTKFAKSQRLDPAPGTAINLADCYEKMGKVADALASARNAMGLLPPGDDRAPHIREQIRRLEARVSRLTIKWSAVAPDGSRVFLDGTELTDDAFAVPREVNPGAHQLLVEHADGEEDEYEVTVALGEARTFVLDAPGGRKGSEAQRDPTARSITPPPPEADTSRTTAAYVIGGVGLLGIAAGVGFSLAAASEKSDAERLEATIGPSPSACNDPNRQGCGELKSSWQAYDRDRNIAAAGFVVGGIGIIAAVVLLVTDTAPEPETAVRRGSFDVSSDGRTIILHSHF